MKREVISEAMKNISEEYRLEALELHNRDVSEMTSMNAKKNSKKLITIGLVAAVTGALGITAFATAYGRMTITEHNPDETVVFTAPAFDIEGYDEDGNSVTIHESSCEVVYESVTREITFDGPEVCNEVQFMPTYLPETYTVMWGNRDEWCDSAQGLCEVDGSGNVYNIIVYYSSDLGPDGMMIIEEPIISEEVIETDTEVIYKLETDYPYGDFHNYYYIAFNTVDGYIVAISNSESMDITEKIYNGLDIMTTGDVHVAEPGTINWAYLCNGVG